MPKPDTTNAYPDLPRPLWQRAIAALGSTLLLLSLTCLAVWLLAILFTDRFLTIQFFYWFNPALVFTAAGLFAVGALARRLSGSRIGRVTPVLIVLSLALLGGRELGVFRWIGNLAAPSPPQGKALRVVHWNASIFDIDPKIDLGQRLSAAGRPDIILVSIQNNPRLWDQMRVVMQTSPDAQIHFLNLGLDKVFSRFPVTATKTFSISFTGEDVPTISPFIRRSLGRFFRFMQLHNRSAVEIEDATIIGLTFDTTAVCGRPTHAWFIDMPSNPVAGRNDLARRVALRGAQLVKQGALPQPDFIAGDFNIPLGSDSLSVYAPGFSKASDSAGLGRLASWPRPREALQLDHILTAPGWRSAEYRLLDPTCSEHLAQTAIIWPEATKR